MTFERDGALLRRDCPALSNPSGPSARLGIGPAPAARGASGDWLPAPSKLGHVLFSLMVPFCHAVWYEVRDLSIAAAEDVAFCHSPTRVKRDSVPSQRLGAETVQRIHNILD